MRKYEMCELCFTGKEPEESYVEIPVYGEIIGPDDRKKVKAFYAGNMEYKVHFFPKVSGSYEYRIFGLEEEEEEKGTIEVKEAKADQHGMVKAKELHFEYEDGTIFYPFGTTVYAMIHQSEKIIEETLASLKVSPFNKVRTCVFPKSYKYNENEPTYYAFEKDGEGRWDVHHPCMEYWDRLEKYIKRMDEMDVQVDLILFHPYDKWGFASLTQKDNLVYLDYLLRRLSAFPNVWWSISNEYDLGMDHKTLEEWEEIEEYIATNDSYHHLLSNHNCFKPWDYSRENITHVSIQTKQFYRIPEWMEIYQKPIVIDECCYEGNLSDNWGSLSGREMTARFWRTFTSGGYCTHGETFLDKKDDIIWWAKGGRLHGDSPARISFLRNIITSLPGPLTPFKEKMDTLFVSENKEMMKKIEKTDDDSFKVFIKAILRMTDEERYRMEAVEHCFKGRYKDEAFLYYYDLRCAAKDTLMLPDTYTYKIEVIDTWNMSRMTIAEEASGETEIRLPGREAIAVLAIRKMENR